MLIYGECRTDNKEKAKREKKKKKKKGKKETIIE
jgi:hypothetical protein